MWKVLSSNPALDISSKVNQKMTTILNIDSAYHQV